MHIETERFEFEAHWTRHGIGFGVGFGPPRHNDYERRRRYFDYKGWGHDFALGLTRWELIC